MRFGRSVSSGGGALNRAAGALAAAGGVAHLAFLSLFAWRVVSGSGLGRYAHVLFAALAAVGLASEVLGWSLVKFGGKTKVRRLGLWSIALSTALAAVLLVVASLTG